MLLFQHQIVYHFSKLLGFVVKMLKLSVFKFFLVASEDAEIKTGNFNCLTIWPSHVFWGLCPDLKKCHFWRNFPSPFQDHWGQEVIYLAFERYNTFIISIFSLLVVAQRVSNRGLSILMALSFWFEIIVGWVLLDLLEFLDHDKNYWYATAHPFSRLPVFFMGICAGVLCVRIQNGDLDALRCK